MNESNYQGQEFEKIWENAEKKAIKIIEKKRPYKIGEPLIKGNIEHYKKYFMKSDHPLSFFSGKVTSDELADIISNLVLANFSNINREYISNLKHGSIDMELEPFHVILGNSTKSDDMIIKWYGMLLNAISESGVQYALDTWPETQRMLQRKDKKEWSMELMHLNKRIVSCSFDQKYFAKRMGVESVYYKEVEKYIEWSSIVFAEYIIQPINPGFLYRDIENFYSSLERIFEAPQMDVVQYDALRERIFFSTQMDTNLLAQKGVLREHLNRVFYEEKIIEDVLICDVEANKKDFYCPDNVKNLISKSKVNPDLIIRAFTDKKKKRANPNDRRKIENVKKFIKKWNDTPGFEKLDTRENNYFQMFMIYKELLCNAARPAKYKQSKSIVGDFIDDMGKYKLKNSEEIFIILKLTRGRFRLFNAPDLYIRYCKLIQKYHELLLNIFDVIDNDLKCMEAIYKLNQKIFSSTYKK